MKTQPHRTRSPLRRDLRLVSAEGFSFSVMVGVGESYLAAFVIALGLGDVASGLVSTVPLLIGGAIQLVTPIGLRRFGSRRRWSVLCAGIQAASFVPLIAGAARGALTVELVFASAALYWGAGMAVGPAWSSWMDALVPRAVRTQFFARRSSLAQVGLVVGLVLGGLVLDRAANLGRPLAGFVIVFLVALAARTLSAALLGSQTDLNPPAASSDRGLPALKLILSPPARPSAMLLGYLLALTAAVTISSPFFSAYMLTELDLTYMRYMMLVGSALGAKVIALAFAGHVARRIGLAGMLRVAWVVIVVVPALWLVSDSYGYLVALQVCSGLAWAMHEYATFLLLFETIREGRRVAILTAYNLGNATATVLGSLAGGALLHGVGEGRSGFVMIFVVSTAMRLVAGVLLTQVADRRLPDQPAFFRTVAIRPDIGAVIRPILATIRRRTPRP
jgi:MFS family permease